MPPEVDYDKLAKQHGGKAAAVDYDALAREVSAEPAAEPRSWADTAADVAIGAAKGVGNTVAGLGSIMYQVPGVKQASDLVQKAAFGDVIPADVMLKGAQEGILKPSNTAQRVGQTAEQVGEFFLPVGAAGKVGKAAEVAKAAGLTLAQGGSPTAAGVSAALTAAIPGASAAKKASGALQRGAEKEVAQALGATKEWAKSEAAKLAPEMLERGVSGSRDAMLKQAKGMAAKVGDRLNDAYATAAQSGATVDSNIIAGNVQLARDALTTVVNGQRRVIPGTEGVVQKMDDLADFVLSLGPDIPVDKAAHIKRTWDQIVSKAGLFGPKATASATDNANAWAVREASGAFREMLNRNPQIADLNKELAFWTGLKNVLKETQKRTQAQAGTGLVAAGSSGAGVVAGALSGDSVQDRATKALLYGVGARQLVKLVQSPAFRTMVTGPMKKSLADALASGSAGQLASATQKIVASLPAQLRPAFAP